MSGKDNRYFKYYDSNMITKSKKMARISLYAPKQLHHRNINASDINCDDWDLSRESAEIDYLIHILKNDYSPRLKITNWQYILMTFNNDNYNISKDDFLAGDITVEKYNEIVDKYNEKIKDAKQRAFRSDFPMPDYNKLVKSFKAKTKKG